MERVRERGEDRRRRRRLLSHEGAELFEGLEVTLHPRLSDFVEYKILTCILDIVLEFGCLHERGA